MVRLQRITLLSLLGLCSLAHAAQVPFVNGQTAATIRNNYSGYVGMQFTVGASAMNVSSLGRLYLPGNSHAHTVKLINARTGVDVPGAAVQLTMVPGTVNNYQYSTLPAAIQLTPGTSYFLVSQEVSGGDTWYDYTPVTSTADAAINGPVYLGSGQNYVLVGVGPPTSWSYVPANFQYSLGAVTPPPTVSITQPSANATLSGTVTVIASASAASGLSVASVSFELNGSTAIGAAVTAPPYQVTLDTTTLADGAYTLSAIATDSAGNQTTSSSVAVSLVNGNVPIGTAFVQAATFGAIRNNYSGFVGMQFSVGPQSLTINSLGRIVVAGNTATHTVKLVNASTGQDVPGGSVQVATAGGTPQQFKYSPLSSAVTLSAATSYYLVSQETSGGDQWYDYSPLTVTSVATVPGAIYSTGASYVRVAAPSYGYVPLSFLYGTGSVHAPPSVTVTSPSAGSVSGTVTFSAQASAASSLEITSLQLMLDGVAFGSPNTTQSQTSTVSLSLTTSTLSNGTHTLSAVANDSSGQSTTSASVSILVSTGTTAAGSPLITAQSLAGSLRSNFSGEVGMELQVGSSPLTVSQVGRFCSIGNSQVHIVKLVQSNGADVTGGSASVSMAGCVAGTYSFGALSSAIKLQANTSYFLVSLEAAGGDQWYDLAPVTATPAAATVLGPVYSAGSGYVIFASPGSSYVPVNLQYQAPAVLPAPSVTITAPAANVTVSGTLTISASATAASSLQITSLQLMLDGVAFGSPNTTQSQISTVSLSLTTSTLSNGTHILSAVASDSSGQSTTSASVSIVVSNGATATGSPLITAQSLAGSLRSNFSGEVGMELQVGSSPLMVSQVGRFCSIGNSQVHIVKLVQSNGADVTGGSASVSMAGCVAGTYSFGALSSAIKLQANTSYFLVSLEAAGGDQWYDLAPVTATPAAATVLGPVYSAGSGYVIFASPGSSYVPVNLQYQTPAVLPAPSVTITAPGANVTVSGTLTISARATAASGLSIASVQFQENGANIGAAVASSGSLYSIQIDSTTLANGSYGLTAIATDSAGNSATSASVTVTVSNAVSSAGQPFITEQSPGAIRNNYSGYVGMEFTVGGAPFMVTQLGRICVAGNSGTHVVKLVNSDFSDFGGGSISLPMADCAAGAYRYGSLAGPVTLAANKSYYLLSLEANGGDQWYDFGPVTSQDQGYVNGPVYVAGGNFNLAPLTGNSFVPLNFLYVAAATAKPVVKFTSPPAFSVISGAVTITATATAAPGLSISSVQFQRTGSNIGAAVTGPGPTYSITLDTLPLQNGGYSLGVIAEDSAGNSTFASSESVTVLNNISAPTVTITTPKPGFSATGMLSVTATAIPASGAAISSLQLLIDGQNFGAACVAQSCTGQLDTTELPSGTHRLTAMAIDSDEGHAISIPVPFQTSNTVTGIGLLNGFIPGLARNYGDWIGMQFTTGCTAISVNALGRIYVPGNVATHMVKLVRASDGGDVPGGSVTIAFAGAILNRVTYAPLAAPIVLPANTAYYLVSQETATGDQFYDVEPILTMGAVTVNGPAYRQSGVWITPPNPNYIYVPLDFKFTVPGVSLPASTTIAGGSPSASKGVAIVPAGCNHVLVTGQSLSNGTTGGPPLSTTQPYSNVMLTLDESAFLPLTEGAGNSSAVDRNVETIDSALGNTMTGLSTNLSFSDAVTNAGVGGASYAQLAQGTAAYSAALAQLNVVKALSAAVSKTYKISGLAVVHGETDEGLGATAAAYEADLVQWQTAYQTDGRAISGQSETIPFFIDQENSWTYSGLATPTVALGQLSAAEDNPTSIFLIGPKYQYHYNDGIHIDNVGYRQEGEQFGKAMKEALLDGTYPKPFAPKSISRSGNLVTLVFNVPSPPLQFDTSTVLPKSAMGFEYSDGTACSPFIVGAQITAGDTVTLTLSSAPTGTNEHVRYALTGIAGSPAGHDQPGSAHGNLKDSDPTVSAYGNDLSNWAVSFDKTVSNP